jgi:hypothetical protein
MPAAIAASATLRASSIPSTGMPADEPAQQVTVVGGDLDDPLIRAQPEAG